MLDMGFFEDIATVTKQCPPERQTLLFSATYPEGIEKLAQQFMRAPEQITVAPPATQSLIEQRFYEVTRPTRFEVVAKFSTTSGLRAPWPFATPSSSARIW